MRIRHIRSLDIWLMSRGNKVLYRGRENPWHSEQILQSAMKRAVSQPQPQFTSSAQAA